MREFNIDKKVSKICHRQNDRKYRQENNTKEVARKSNIFNFSIKKNEMKHRRTNI